MQIEAFGPWCRITVPSESDSGASGGESRGSRDSGKRCERYDSQGRLLPRTLRPMPSMGKDGCKGKDRDGENACGDLRPRLARARAPLRFDRNYRNYGLYRCSRPLEMSWSRSLELSGSKDGMDIDERARSEADRSAE